MESFLETIYIYNIIAIEYWTCKHAADHTWNILQLQDHLKPVPQFLQTPDVGFLVHNDSKALSFLMSDMDQGCSPTSSLCASATTTGLHC